MARVTVHNLLTCISYQPIMYDYATKETIVYCISCNMIELTDKGDTKERGSPNKRQTHMS